MTNVPPEIFTVTTLENYAIAEVCSTYAGVRQRWLVVQSESRKQADLKQLNKRIAKAQTKKAKALKDLSAHPFACPKGYRSAYETDALDAANTFDNKLRYHTKSCLDTTL